MIRDVVEGVVVVVVSSTLIIMSTIGLSRIVRGRGRVLGAPMPFRWVSARAEASRVRLMVRGIRVVVVAAVEGMETGIETENETVIVMIGIATGLETTTIVDEIGGPGRDLDPDRPGDATAMIIIVGKGIPHGIQGATTAIKGVG